jgi:hypothetical protein
MENHSSSKAAWIEADAATVFFILDTQFGDQLLSLPKASPVWLIDSALNTPIVRGLWANAQTIDSQEITTFTCLPTWNLADFFESMLITIYEHHGPMSRENGYSALIVLGLPITPVIEEILANDNLEISRITEVGFMAKRLA